MRRPQETARQWISGLALMLTALICLFAFWHLAPGPTLVVAIVFLIAAVLFFWLAGKDR